MVSKLTTKSRILEKATALFNRFGYVNVRLQHIADEAELSVGNLAYHFKTKDDILESIYQSIEIEQKALLHDFMLVPLFVNIDTHLSNTYRIHQNFSFFYSDTFEILRAFPQIKKKYREYTKWFIIQVENMLLFNASRGAFLEEKIDSLYKNLATQYWMNTELWLYQNRIRGISEINEEDFKMAVWSLLIPYFTDIGVKEYQQLHGYENFNWL